MKKIYLEMVCVIVCLAVLAGCASETVIREPQLVLNTNWLDFGMTETSLTFDILNEGEVTAEWNLASLEECDWLQVSPTKGTIEPGQSNTLQVNLLRENVTGCMATVLFVSTSGQSLPLKITAIKKPERYIKIQPNVLDAGTDERMSLTMFSHYGETAYELSVEGDASWAKFSKDKGVIPEHHEDDMSSIEEIEISVDRTGLLSGKYGFTLVVRTDLGENRIPVSMTVDKPTPGIYSVEDLIAFRNARNANADITHWMDENGVITLYADLDLTGVVWHPVKDLYEDETFDGNGHTIRMNKLIIGKDERTWGFFFRNSGIIKDLGIEIYMKTDKYNNIGVVVYGNSGKVQRCKVTVLSESGFSADTWFGGIVNQNYGMIESCTVHGNLEIHGVSGGICCRNYGYISECVNHLKMVGIGMDTGGITGYNEVVARYKNSGQVHNCVNNAEIVLYDGSNRGLGGIAGLMMNGLLNNCVNNGDLYAEGKTMKVGGVIGCGTIVIVGLTVQGTRTITRCHNNANVEGNTPYIGCIAGDFAGLESKIEGCTYGGHVNGVPGDVQNAIGSDLRS